jgi:thiosulfate dehydrogenase
MPSKDNNNLKLNSYLKKIVILFVTMMGLVFFMLIAIIFNKNITSFFNSNEYKNIEIEKIYADAAIKDSLQIEMSHFWKPVPLEEITDSVFKKKVEYGKELIEHTAKYLGPKGSVQQSSNGMNCNNCHLDAGTKPWGNNYGSVYSTYPKMRARSGKIENLFKRINDCFERSLNGKALPENSSEMQAMIAYIEYIGKNVPKDSTALASGIRNIELMNRAASPAKGKPLYEAKCASCHQTNGQGMLNETQTEYTYPPLWGKNSYNKGAGLFRISRFAGYIKYNMPLGATYDSPQLTDEESWDIAAYVESLDRPSKDLSADWPKIGKKPFDHPFGPFEDKYSEQQHKYGPFKPIKKDKKKREEAEELLKKKEKK